MEDSIRQLMGELKEAHDWEGPIFRWACGVARALTERLLGELDAALAEEREAGWVIEGMRTHTIATRFGELRVKRRLYRDEQGQYRYLLDEAMGVSSGPAMSQQVGEIGLLLATCLPYAQASAVVEAVLPEGHVSKMRIWRQVQALGHAEREGEEAAVQAVYGEGRPVPTGERQVARLFVEADGVNVPLQREEGRRTEIKVGVAHEGWEAVGADRYRLVEKTVYASVVDGDAFWERFSLKLGQRYDVAGIEQTVVGGDGARWVREGAGLLDGHFQLDRYHLHRALRTAYGGDEVGAHAVYRACVAGQVDEAVQRLREREGRVNGKAAERIRHVRRYITENAEGLRDYRERLGAETTGLRGLGAIESNVDKLVAHRMKHRGMSWRVRGADSMARLIVLREEGRLEGALGREGTTGQALRAATLNERIKERTQRGLGEWLQATLPALHGPHADRPWVRALATIARQPLVCSRLDAHLPTEP